MKLTTITRIISLFVCGVFVAACDAGWEGNPFLSPLVARAEPVTMPRPVEVLSLEEAQARITFELPMPQALPAELMLEGARVFTPNHAQIFYGARTGEAGLSVEVSISAIEQYIYPAASGQSVSGNGITGECIEGSWQGGQWREDADATVLYWADEELFYRMSQSGLAYGCEEMVRIGVALKRHASAVVQQAPGGEEGELFEEPFHDPAYQKSELKCSSLPCLL